MSILAMQFVLSPQVDGQTVDDGAVLIEKETGNVFELNGTGREVWKLLMRGASGLQICESVSAKYEVAPEQLERDVETLLTELLRRGLIAASAETRETAR